MNETSPWTESSLAEKLADEKERFRTNADPAYVQAFEDFIYTLKISGIEAGALKENDKAPDFALKNALRKSVMLAEALKAGPVILTWYRGGWCPYCNLALHEMQRFLPEFKKAKASLIALSPELPDKSLSTKEKLALEFEVLTDTDNAVAKKYGGVHILSSEVRDYYNSLKVFEYYTSEFYDFPVPATYIVDSNFMVRFAFVDVDFRNRAEPAEILRVLKNL